MNKTTIEWVLNPDGTQGYTSNPVRGECPVGCSYCYVRPFRTRYGWHKDIRFYPEELIVIRNRKKPSGIFLGSTMELFHDKTIQCMPDIMDTISFCDWHRFYLLTKQPQNLPQFSPFPENCWVGVTITNADMLYQAHWYLGIKVEAKVKFLSCEPLLDRISIGAGKKKQRWLCLDGINWVIIGACTGTKDEILELIARYPALTLMPYGKKWTAQPRIEWVQEIVRAVDKAGIAVFLKGNLEPLFAKTVTKDDKWVWAKDLGYGGLYRQEMP